MSAMSLEQELYNKAMANANAIMRLTGLHLKSDNNDKKLTKRLFKRKYFIFTILLMLPDMLAQFVWFIDAAKKGKTMTELTFPAPCIAICFLCLIKTLCFVANEPAINDIVETLQMLQSVTANGNKREEVESELIRFMSFLKKSINLLKCIDIISLGSYAILPFLMMGITYAETGEIQYFYAYVQLYPFDVYNIYVFPFLYCHQLHVSGLIVLFILGVDVLYYVCCTYIHIQFRFLHYDLERIIVGDPEQHRRNENYFQEISTCLMRHRELIRCVGLLEVVYSKSTLFNCVCSSIIICLTGFNATAMESWIMMMPFVGFIFLGAVQIFMFCYFGDLIMRSSMRVSDAVYNCKWYNARVSDMKHLLIVLVRAQKPCKLTAYGFSDINLQTFSRILSSSWSYFALLSSVNGRK